MKNAFVRFLTLVMVIAVISAAGSSFADEPLAKVQQAPATLQNIQVMGLLVGQNGRLQAAGPFSTDAVYSLKAAVSYSNATPGVHIQELKFYTPDGSLYQTVTTAFTARRERRGDVAQVKVKDSPVPVRVQYTPPVRNNTVIWGELPVAGTWIQRLKGNWKVDVHLDGSETPLGTLGFKIN